MTDLGFESINWLAVLAGGVIYMIVGGLWYGPIAGKAWMAEMGLTEEEVREQGSPTGAMIQSFIAALFMSAGLAFVLSMPVFREAGWQGGMMTGFILSVLLVGGSVFPNYAFENKTLRHFLIHMGNTTLAMMLVGAMMAYWR